MNCEKIREDIFLYDELSPLDKRAVDVHVSGCKTCEMVFSDHRRAQSLVHEVAQVQLRPSNSARLTSQVMDAIGKRQRQSSSTGEGRGYRLLRLAMTTCSIALVIVFVNQHLSSPGDLQHTAEAKTTVLNTATMLRQLHSADRAEPQVWYSCARQTECTNPLVQQVRSKLSGTVK